MLQNQERKCERACLYQPTEKSKKKHRNAGQTFVLIIKVKETRYFHLRVIAFWIYLNCIKCGRTKRIKELLLDFAYKFKLSKLICVFLSSIIFYSFLIFLYIAVVLDFVASN